MDYEAYAALYERAAEKGLVSSGLQCSEDEWNVLSAAVKNQMVKRITELLDKAAK